MSIKYMKEVSLSPYPGHLYITNTKQNYAKAHKKIFSANDEITDGIDGRTSIGEGKHKQYVYLVYGKKVSTIAHELSHVILHVFEVCGIDPREGNGEPFCYMLSQLMETR